MDAKDKISPKMATYRLCNAAKKGDVALMQSLVVEHGANPDCWVKHSADKMLPLVTVAARAGQPRAAVWLLNNITDKMIASHGKGDWRADYDLSPISAFARLGEPTPAVQAKVLGWCKDTMTQQQWSHLFFNCVNCVFRADNVGVLEQCVTRLDRQEIIRIRDLVLAFGIPLPRTWDLVDVHLTRLEFEEGTRPAGARGGPIHRM